MSADKVKTPWTEEQIEALNQYQEKGFFHPYTCRNEHAPAYAGYSKVLAATRDGWWCWICGYRQDWAHSASLDIGLMSEEEWKQQLTGKGEVE